MINNHQSRLIATATTSTTITTTTITNKKIDYNYPLNYPLNNYYSNCGHGQWKQLKCQLTKIHEIKDTASFGIVNSVAREDEDHQKKSQEEVRKQEESEEEPEEEQEEDKYKCQYQSLSTSFHIQLHLHCDKYSSFERQNQSETGTAASIYKRQRTKKYWSKNNSYICNSLLPNTFLRLILCYLLWLLVLFDMPDRIRADWLMDCGDCHCKWQSGKKTADCKNLTLATVPENLSNEIQVLDLSYNRIVYLEQNAFLIADLQNLHKLYIRNSSLQQINSASFTQLEILIELDLSNNLLRSLSSDLFGKLVKVRAIVLNGNLLERLGDGVFQNLKYLHKIELKDNRLVHISTQTFINVPLLSQIYLNNNRLNYLRKETFESLKRLTALSLDGNLWNCTCELQVFRDFVLRRNLYTPPTDCYYPKHLRGMLWVEDQPEAFACRPRIIFPTKGASINTSKENVTLICRVHASPNTHIAWDYNKQIYRSPNGITETLKNTNQNDHNYNRIHIQVIRDEEALKEREFGRDVYISRLTIVGAEKNDEGIYTCIAENAGGKDSVQMNLLIESSGNRDLFQGNLAVVISLMALALLSVSVFLATVTCCIYKRFLGTMAAHQHRHHHHHHHHLDLGGSVGGSGSRNGSGNARDGLSDTNPTNHATATTNVTGGTDVTMLGMIVGNGCLDEPTSKQYKKHHQQQQQLQQQTTLNGGIAFSFDDVKYSELVKRADIVQANATSANNGGNGDGGGNGGGGGGGGSDGTSPLIEVGFKSGNDMQPGHMEKSYLVQSNDDDLLHIKYKPGRLLDEINRTMVAVSQTVGHNNENSKIGGGGGGGLSNIRQSKRSSQGMSTMPPINTANSRIMPMVVTGTAAATNANDFQPDLLPAYVNNKVGNNENNRRNELDGIVATASPSALAFGFRTCKTIKDTTVKDGAEQSSYSTALYTNSVNPKQIITETATGTATGMGTGTITGTGATLTRLKNNKMSLDRSKYNASAKEYLQAKYGAPISNNNNRRQIGTSQDHLRLGNTKVNASNAPKTPTAPALTSTSLSTNSTIGNSVDCRLPDNVNNRSLMKSLTMPQRTVCGATTIATPTDTNVSYEYRQPPPPPYNAAHRTAGNLLLGRRDVDLTAHQSHHSHQSNKYNQAVKDHGYRETGRATIVTGSPSLNFPQTTSGNNNNNINNSNSNNIINNCNRESSSSNISPRRQLL